MEAEVSNDAQKMNLLFLQHDRERLAKVWGVTESEVSRKLSGGTGISFQQFIAALDEIGIQLVWPDEDLVVVERSVHEALKALARKALEG